ncbi:MAG: hypothetical protein SRB2_00878 [Desulfobacteraceae bacterium Eth-SRB2]|nr:MAG: hypothetical protein SRB2_00878 [Desulfobacteraceae bacterium Eth-SRB2]
MFKNLALKTFRFLILNRGGRIAWRKGIKVVELTKNNQAELLYKKISTALNNCQIKKAA